MPPLFYAPPSSSLLHHLGLSKTRTTTGLISGFPRVLRAGFSLISPPNPHAPLVKRLRRLVSDSRVFSLSLSLSRSLADFQPIQKRRLQQPYGFRYPFGRRTGCGRSTIRATLIDWAFPDWFSCFEGFGFGWHWGI